MNPHLEIFSQGDEVVTGQIVDTNAAWLSEQAVQQGFIVTRHTAVGDDLWVLISLLQEIAPRADCCFCTGGLGPTSDDLTAEAVAKAFDLPLILDEQALAQMESYFARRQKIMPVSNRKQALLPQGSLRLDNEHGTAAGFAIQIRRCWFVFMPGVPSEMKPMYLNKVQAQLSQRFTLQPSGLVTLRTIGIGESDLQERLNTLSLPDSVKIGYRAELGEVQVKLLFPADYVQADKYQQVQQVAEQLGDSVYTIDENTSNSLIAVLDKHMSAGKYTLAVIETISCGLLASLCVGKDWLIAAQYQPKPLSHNLKTLATAYLHSSGANCVLVQLYDGDNPTVLHNGLLTEHGFYSSTQTIAGALPRKQHQAALSALDLLRRWLQHKL